MKCYLSIRFLLKSNYWGIFRIGILGSSIASAILTQGIFTFAQTEPASKLTLYVPRTNEVIDANTWCQGSDAVGTGRPFGFNRIRFYIDRTDPKNPEYLIGCLTNNTQQILRELLIKYSGTSNETSEYIYIAGFGSLDISPRLEPGETRSLDISPRLEPGETRFFKTKFAIDPEIISLEIDLQGLLQQEQTTTYAPLERLVIQRRQ